ncbi:MAG TPA: DUF4367 domain-containing protein [Clostridia bacterium]
MTEQEKSEIIFDAMMKIAVREAFEREMSELGSEEADETDKPSPELEKRVKRLIDKSYMKSKMRRYMKLAGKIAVCICITFTIISLSVRATRNAIFNAIIELQEKYTRVDFGESETVTGIYRPTYLPEGFSETSTVKFGNTVMIKYSKADDAEIVLSQRPAESGTSLVDNENTDYMEVEVSGVTAYLFSGSSANDISTLIWQANGTVFELTSTISIDELIKIGKSLKK